MTSNPLLQDWDTPYGLPPFDRIRPGHFPPAFEQGLAQHLAEIEAIARAAEPPGFDNTAAALDRSGRLLRRIEAVFHNLCASESSPELREVEREMAPRLAAHRSAVYLNAALFERLEALHERRATLGLGAEQQRLLERLHLDFVMAGARLAPAAKVRYAEVMQQLAELNTRFSQHVLGDEAAYHLPLAGEADLDGLPDWVRNAAREAASQRAVDGHVVTLSRSLIVPFLTFSKRRDLREAAWRAWTSRGELVPERDTRALAAEIMKLRLEQARLHGFESYADYALRDRMAGTPDAVAGLLQRVWGPAKARAAEERALLEAQARAAGDAIELQPWDWRHYAEQVRVARYQLDDNEVKPYLQLDRMIDAMFDCAGRLFGVRFVEQRGLALYHPDVRAWEVRDAGTDALVGLFLGDNFARPSKRGGAWMSLYREQMRNTADGSAVLPIVVNNNNFAKGAPGTPTLLSFDDVRTLFHEFGHGLHGLLSSVTYERLSGTNVLQDFVELPSQIYEHWALEPQVLKRHALHVQTGEPMPDALVERLKRARHFNQGYETVQYVGSALLDLALHRKTSMDGLDITAFERDERARLGVPQVVGLMHRLPHFRHLFASDSYAAGYYVYMWAEVLDADGFNAFVEAGDIFHPATAGRLKRHIYSAGNSVEPGAAYRAFRGRDADVQAMLVDRGLVAEPA
jgi:peptidyl-dipeptidase Dcp